MKLNRKNIWAHARMYTSYRRPLPIYKVARELCKRFYVKDYDTWSLVVDVITEKYKEYKLQYILEGKKWVMCKSNMKYFKY